MASPRVPFLAVPAFAVRDFAARSALVLAAVLAVLIGAPKPVTAVLSLLALAGVSERLARTRNRGGTDAVLVGVGALLVTLILVGLVVQRAAIGSSPRSWSLGLGLLGLIGLAAAQRRGAHESDEKGLDSDGRDQDGPAVQAGGPAWLRDVPWALVSGLVVVAALVISARAADGVAQSAADPIAGATRAASIQFAFGPGSSIPGSSVQGGSVQGSSVQVVVSAAQRTGPLEVRTDAADGTSLSYPLFVVQPGASVTMQLTLPLKGRFVITLNDPEQTAPLRTLTLDR